MHGPGERVHELSRAAQGIGKELVHVFQAQWVQGDAIDPRYRGTDALQHPHERMSAQLFIRKTTPKQPHDLGETGVKVKLFGLMERRGPAGKQ